MAEEMVEGARRVPIADVKTILGRGSDLTIRARARDGEIGAVQIPLHPGTASSRFRYMFDVHEVLKELVQIVENSPARLTVRRGGPNLYQSIHQLFEEASAPMSIGEIRNALDEQLGLKISAETVVAALDAFSEFAGEGNERYLEGRVFEPEPEPELEPEPEQEEEQEPAQDLAEIEEEALIEPLPPAAETPEQTSSASNIQSLEMRIVALEAKVELLTSILVAKIR